MEPQTKEFYKSTEDEDIPKSIIPLLKPVHNSPFSANTQQCNWVLINVCREEPKIRRFCLNITKHPSQLPHVLPNVLNTAGWPNWHTFFLFLPRRHFTYWNRLFPMSPMLAKKSVSEHPKTTRRRFRFRRNQKMRGNQKDQARAKKLLPRRRPR